MGARKKFRAPLPKAAEGESWVLSWQIPAIREENDWGTTLCAHQRTTLIKCTQGNYSPVGLGTIKVESVEIYGKLDGAKLAGALSGCTHLGSGAYIGSRPKFVVPDKAAVMEAIGIEQALQSIQSVNQSNKLNMSKHVKQIASLEYSIVLPNSGAATDSEEYPYGLAYVPKLMCDGLIIIERDHILRDTHYLVDLLGTKHNIMNQLGFADAIILDNKLINNRNDYEVAQRDKGLLSVFGGTY